MRNTLWIVPVLLAAACGAKDPGRKDESMFSIGSPAFGMNEAIPRMYTGDGEDASPPLSISHVPEGAVELALIVDDPDAPTPSPWVHWVAFGIPVDTTRIPEGGLPAGTIREGRNSWAGGKTIGYRGPQPPSGTHRYFFRLYALDAEITLSAGATKEELQEAMEGHILARAELIGLYSAK